jgi:RNA polymerase sigma-70 factor, ECF subfamily
MEEDFTEIYDTYVVKIYRFIFLKVDSRETAEDLCADVFAKTLKEYRRSEIQNIQAFLYQVARNILADYYRNKSKARVIPLEEGDFLLGETDSLLERIALNAEIEDVKKKLTDLREEYQNFIIWRYLDELSIPEIAQITGKSEGSCRIGVHRALESLRKRMESAEENVPSVPV